MQQMRSQLGELTSKQDTLRRDFQNLSTAFKQAEVHCHYCHYIVLKVFVPWKMHFVN